MLDDRDRLSGSELFGHERGLDAFADTFGAPSLVELDRQGMLTHLSAPMVKEQATVHSLPTRARG